MSLSRKDILKITGEMLKKTTEILETKYDPRPIKVREQIQAAVPERSPNRDAIVLFTGGVDSTLALLWALISYQYKSIRAVSIRSEKRQVTTLVDPEQAKEVTALIKKMLPEECAAASFVHDVLTIDTEESCRFNRETPVDRKAIQVPDSPMLPAILSAMMVNRDGTDIIDGYCLGENYWPVQHDLEAAGKIIFQYKNSRSSAYRHPLMYMDRTEILYLLLEVCPALIPQLSYCPPVHAINGKNCGRCYKCLGTLHAIEHPWHRSSNGWQNMLTDQEKFSIIGNTDPAVENQDIFKAINNTTILQHLLNHGIHEKTRWKISMNQYPKSRHKETVV